MADEPIAGTSIGSRATIARALRDGARLLDQAGIESALLDAEVLLCHVLDVSREQLYACSAGRLAQPTAARYRELITRRGLCEPVAYIIGKKEFWSLDLFVTPDVLIPRPETELLVEVCLKLARVPNEGGGVVRNFEKLCLQAVPKDLRGEAREKSTSAGIRMKYVEARRSSVTKHMGLFQRPVRILELGTGSGAIAISLAEELEGAEIVATDVSPASLQVARKNAARHGLTGRIEFVAGDLFGPLAAKRRFDFIVVNPPYVRSAELKTLPPDVRNWEPLLALHGGEDGLNYYRGIASEAHRYVAEGGCILLEIGSALGADVSRLFRETGRYATPRIYRDYGDRDRVFATTKLCTLT
jgi:release factor glutamine methyltransferase